MRYTVQVGSFTSEENAQALERSLGDIPEVEVVRYVIGGNAYFRVRAGNFARRPDAVALARELASRGLSVVIVERDR